MELLLLYKGFTPIGDFFNHFVLRDYDMNARQLEVYQNKNAVEHVFSVIVYSGMKNQQKLKLHKILESTDGCLHNEK